MTVTTEPFVQTPSTLWVPKSAGTLGDEVNGFADLIGVPRDATQKRDIDAINSYGEDGRWLTLETCVVEGRQNGKTKAVYLPTILYRLFIYMSKKSRDPFRAPDRMFWTSQLMKTSRDSFEVIKRLIDENPVLSRRVKDINEGKGDESVELHSGATLDFVARSKSGGRGLSGSYGFFDEGLFVSAEFMGALIPTMSSRENPQIGYASSPGRSYSSQLRALQGRGRAMNDEYLTFIEYKADGEWDNPPCARGIRCTHLIGDPASEGCAFGNPVYWRQANHSMQYGRMREAFVRAEHRSLCTTTEGVIEFGCERMGYTELAEGVIDPDRISRVDWIASRNEDTEPVGEVVLSVDIPPSGDRASIGVAGWNQYDKIHFGVIDYRMGTGWVVPRLIELIDRHELMCGVLWQPEAPVGALKNQLLSAGVNMLDVTAGDFAKHCGSFKTHITSEELNMRSSSLLDSAFDSAERRVSVEGAWRWDRRKGGGDISPLCAVTMCVGGVDEFGRRDPHVLVF